MRLHADPAEQDEDEDEGQGRDERGQAERVGQGLKFLDVHGASPDSTMRKSISHGPGKMVVSATSARQWSCVTERNVH
ncbi:hypothetical protein GCM10010372_58340 [Streptomyces tauricus]|nr:hypothetical protein GCM10010372_58340 [Streptomyces tauricus]